MPVMQRINPRNEVLVTNMPVDDGLQPILTPNVPSLVEKEWNREYMFVKNLTLKKSSMKLIARFIKFQMRVEFVL